MSDVLTREAVEQLVDTMKRNRIGPYWWKGKGYYVLQCPGIEVPGAFGLEEDPELTEKLRTQGILGADGHAYLFPTGEHK